MAYYDLGKYEDAERWLNRAKTMDKTMVASEYNLGRIAFARARYEEAAEHFEKILVRDPGNTMALKGAAYSRIKNGDLARAEEHYSRVLELVPESADDGFNYALVLYALNKYEAAEETLARYPYALEENKDALLLLARVQASNGKPEAADSYEKYTASSSPSAQVRREYGKVLETLGLYAKALEQYRAGLSAVSGDTGPVKRQDLLFDSARVLLTADPENPEGMTELTAAREAGFADTKALEDLALDPRLKPDNQDPIKKMIDAINNPPAVIETTPEETSAEEVE